MLPNGPLSYLAHSTSISIPSVLYYDSQDHILVNEVLGPLLTLDDYLAAYSSDEPELDASSQEVCHKLGTRIGEFFAKMHSPQSLNEVQESRSDVLRNSITHDLISQIAVRPIEKHLIQYEVLNAASLFERVLADYHRPSLPEERCFVLGDLMPGDILVEASGNGTQQVGVIDWEFSAIDRGPNGDMARFLASLHLSLLAAPPGSLYFGAIKSMIRGINLAYS